MASREHSHDVLCDEVDEQRIMCIGVHLGWRIDRDLLDKTPVTITRLCVCVRESVRCNECVCVCVCLRVSCRP
jgi:hypothetical protein